MTVLIFEGVDNLGKSTIINKISSNFKDIRDITMIHATGPKCEEGQDPNEVQELTFIQNMAKCNIIARTEHTHKYTKKNIVFMDRSHFGEYVYGQIYRNADPIKVQRMLHKVHDNHLGMNLVVIHLEASPEFVVAHDDNKSFTSNYDPEKRLVSVKHEIDLFNECFERFGTLGTLRNYMKVNVEGENGNYRNIDEIYNEIMNNLAEMNIQL